MLDHILYFVLIGVALAVIFTIADKFIEKVKDAKKRK